MPKKTKAIKVSDTDKAWNKKSKPTVYKLDSIPLNKIILIVCEGQTEKCYFESFPVLGLTIKAINLRGQSKLKLVEETKDFVKADKDNYDYVWCVFDMDVKSGEVEYSEFDNAINKALKLGYKVAYSNDSFELWFYLHYNKSFARHNRAFYYSELSKLFDINYVKHGKTLVNCQKNYAILKIDPKSSQDLAIKRAKELFDEQQHLKFHEQNQVTKVYELVEVLNANLRK
jgi:hypothetical protein